MKNVLFLKARNEDTMLPRVLRVLAQQGLLVQNLHMAMVSNEEVDVKIELLNKGAEFAAKMLEKQPAILRVSC